MTGVRGRRASIAAAAALAAILAAAGAPAAWAQAGADALGAPPSGEYRSAVTVGSGALLPTDGYEYRFSTTGEWRRLDRPLSLDAFPGERRVYRLFVRQSGRSETILDYVIDRRPPDAPTLSPPAGDAGPSLVVGVAAAPGSVIMLSLDGAPFSVFDPAAPPAVQAKADSTRVVWAAAYAIDPAGNAGAIARSAWRLVPAGLVPSHAFRSEVSLPGSQTPAGLPAGSPALSAAYEARRGLVVTLTVPPGSTPLLSCDSSPADPGLPGYARLGPSASNKQPWRVLLKDGALHFYEDKAPGYSDAFAFDIQRIDMGIAAAHADLALRERGISGRFDPDVRLDVRLPERLVYAFSWLREA